jgi:hypothetical protein
LIFGWTPEPSCFASNYNRRLTLKAEAGIRVDDYFSVPRGGIGAKGGTDGKLVCVADALPDRSDLGR